MSACRLSKREGLTEPNLCFYIFNIAVYPGLPSTVDHEVSANPFDLCEGFSLRRNYIFLCLNYFIQGSDALRKLQVHICDCCSLNRGYTSIERFASHTRNNSSFRSSSLYRLLKRSNTFFLTLSLNPDCLFTLYFDISHSEPIKLKLIGHCYKIRSVTYTMNFLICFFLQDMPNFNIRKAVKS
jgi:hypothetical protein